MLAIKSVYDCVDGVFYPFFQQIHYPQNMGVKETWKLKKKKKCTERTTTQMN